MLSRVFSGNHSLEVVSEPCWTLVGHLVELMNFAVVFGLWSVISYKQGATYWRCKQDLFMATCLFVSRKGARFPFHFGGPILAIQHLFS